MYIIGEFINDIKFGYVLMMFYLQFGDGKWDF